MNNEEFWKNFKLGSELDIAGRFIYNGIKVFDDMEGFYLEEDIFEFLYFTAVGIERLLKVVVILSEHNTNSDLEAFEQSLITHNHSDLMQRAMTSNTISLGKVHWKFLALLAKFYKSHRYDRYSFSSFSAEDKEQIALIGFIEEGLAIEVDTTTIFGITRNDRRIKKFMGRVIGRISDALYEVVVGRARRLNLYTYELRVYGKAYKTFLAKQYDFEREKAFTREMIVYLLGKENERGHNAEFMGEITPLEFDPALEADYFLALESDLKKLSVLDELDHLYEESVSDPGDRLAELEAGVGELYLGE